MKKFNVFFLLLAIFGLSFNLHSQIHGNYEGNANIVCTTLFQVNENYEGIVVALNPNPVDTIKYNLVLNEIDLGDGIIIPSFILPNVAATPSGANYNLSAPDYNFVVPEIVIPPNEVFPNGTTLNNVPVKVKMISGKVEGNKLTFKLTVTPTIVFLMVPIDVTYEGMKMENPFPGEGTWKNPWLIYKLSDLYMVNYLTYNCKWCLFEKYLKLMANIDASEMQEGWTAIGSSLNYPFTAHFDGNGYAGYNGTYKNRLCPP